MSQANKDRLTSVGETGETTVEMSHGYIIIETPWTDKPVKIHCTDVDKLNTLCEEKKSGYYSSTKKISALIELQK